MFDDVKVRRKVDSSQQRIKSLNAKIDFIFGQIEKAESSNNVKEIKVLLRQHSDLVKARYSLVLRGV